MGVIIYQGGWKGGRSAQLNVGQRYYGADIRAQVGADTFRSITVPDGIKVTVYRNGDLKCPKGNIWERMTLYPGYYEDLSFYPTGQPHGIFVETAVGVRESECVKVWVDDAWGYRSNAKYNARWNLPIGKNNADTQFPYDQITWFMIPEGMSATFHDGAHGGTSVTISGYALTTLENYGLNDAVDDITVSKDGYSYVRTEYGSLSTEQPDGIYAILEQEIDNRNGVTELGGELNFSETVSESLTRSWESTTGLTVGVEIGTGESSPVQAKLSVSVSQEFSVGQEKTASADYTVSQTASVGGVPPGKVQKYQLTIEKRKATVPFTVILRNNRTGQEVHRSGVDTARFASVGSVRAL